MIGLTLLGILGLLSLFTLLALRMPVALSMLEVDFIGAIIANAHKFMAVGMAEDNAWRAGSRSPSTIWPERRLRQFPNTTCC